MIDNVGAEAQAPVSAPEMISKAEATELIKKEKMQALDKARREYEDKFQAEMQRAQSSQGVGGMQPQINPDDIAEKVMAKFMAQQGEQRKQQERQALEAEMNRVVDSYKTKMSQGEAQFEDFKDVMADFNPGSFPQLVYLVSNLDTNAAAVMYELAKNPVKLSALNSLALTDPQYALKQLQKVATSVADNQSALENNQVTPAPLNRPKPTATGSTSGGAMSLADYKKAPFNKKR